MTDKHQPEATVDEEAMETEPAFPESEDVAMENETDNEETAKDVPRYKLDGQSNTILSIYEDFEDHHKLPQAQKEQKYLTILASKYSMTVLANQRPTYIIEDLKGQNDNDDEWIRLVCFYRDARTQSGRLRKFDSAARMAKSTLEARRSSHAAAQEEEEGTAGQMALVDRKIPHRDNVGHSRFFAEASMMEQIIRVSIADPVGPEEGKAPLFPNRPRADLPEGIGEAEKMKRVVDAAAPPEHTEYLRWLLKKRETL